MNIDKLIYDVKEGIRAYSNDAHITNARILHLVDVMRAKYIRQHQQRNIGESVLDYSQVLFIELERVDRSYLPSLPIGKQILRSVKKIPRFITRSVFKHIEIRPIDRIGVEIEYMDKQRAVYAPAISDTILYSFIDDDKYLYLIGPDTTHLFLKNVAMTLILETPTDIMDFNEPAELLTDYPVSDHLWAAMKPELMDTLFKELNIPIDTIDDNKAVQ